MLQLIFLNTKQKISTTKWFIVIFGQLCNSFVNENIVKPEHDVFAPELLELKGICVDPRYYETADDVVNAVRLLCRCHVYGY